MPERKIKDKLATTALVAYSFPNVIRLPIQQHSSKDFIGSGQMEEIDWFKKTEYFTENVERHFSDQL